MRTITVLTTSAGPSPAHFERPALVAACMAAATPAAIASAANTIFIVMTSPFRIASRLLRRKLAHRPCSRGTRLHDPALPQPRDLRRAEPDLRQHRLRVGTERR